MPILDGIVLIVHALAAWLIVVLVRKAATALQELNSPAARQRVFDLCLPMILTGPMAAVSMRSGEIVRVTGAISISLPVATAVFGIGLFMVSGGISTRAQPDSGRVQLAGAAAVTMGIILLLLAAANRLSVVVGQTLFAVWAILMWLNAPGEEQRDVEHTNAAPRNRLALLTLGMFALALAQGAAVWMLDSARWPIAGAVFALEISIVLCVVWQSAGGLAAARTGLWSALYGILLAIALTSLAALARASWPFREEGDGAALAAIRYGVAHGYGFLAVEAMALIVVAGLAVGVRAGGIFWRGWQKSLGGILIVLGALLCGWRLGAM